MYVSEEKASQAESIIRDEGGSVRTAQAKKLGIHPRTLYFLRDKGRLVRVSRGLYRLADMPPMEAPDLMTVGARVPDAVICLLSALSFHGLTTEIPHRVHFALPIGIKAPRIDHPPIEVYNFSGPAYSQGIAEHRMDGVSVKIYEPAKSIADAFKFRRSIGLDVAIEALKMCMSDRCAPPAELLKYAKICRVGNVMRPYLEALL